MALIQTVHLSMANFKSAPVVPAVQNDTDRQVKMIIDDYTLTSGLTGKIAFERSDGTHYETAAELVLADNAFVADIDQALTQPGRTMVQLKVTDTLTVSTFSFVIFVEADNSGTVTPQEGIDLVTAVEAAEDAADRAESAASMFDEDVQGYVDEWLDAHPEVTTTVQDGSLTEAKFSDALKLKTIKDYVTPEMFGAVGDGIADDTTELQSCISNGKNVVLTGTYRITAPLNFNSKHDIWVFGGKITRDQNQTFNTIVGSGADNIHFVGVTFDGNGNDRNMSYTWKDNVQACMILAGLCKRIYVEDCKVLNFNYGIFILGADVENSPSSFDNTSMNGVIRNCEFYNCNSGIDTYGKSTLIDHNVFYNSTGSSIQLEGNNSASDIDNPMSDQEYFNSVTSAIISNNLFIDNAGIDIIVHPNSYGVSIYDNLHLNYYQAIKADNYNGSKGINIHHNSMICQKEQTIGSSSRPTAYTATAEVRGNVYFNNNQIFSPYVGVFTHGNTTITNNYIDKAKISGIAIYDDSTATGITILKGNVINRHSPLEGTWYGCNALYVGQTMTTLYILDTIIYTTLSRPVLMVPGTEAIVKNLMSNAESLAITKPSGIYDYSNDT